MQKVVTFGELLLRLSTERFLRFSQAKSFNANFGGGEFNVAVSLANLELQTQFVTALPNNAIGNSAAMEMRKLNIGSKHIHFDDSRIGIYFLETGAGTRSSNVIYDRTNSSMSKITKGTFNWEKIFENTTWFHWSGITPAISQGAADACLDAIETAHSMGITISSDLNYRSKLWNYGKEPQAIMPEMLKYSNVILGDIDTAYFMLGKNKISPNYQDIKSLPALYDKLFDVCPNLDIVATTLRYSISASHQRIGGVLYDKKTVYDAKIKEVTPVVDRIGSGDAFMGGLIYGLLDFPDDKQKAINLAVASCCLKHTIYGDYNLVTKGDLDKFINSENTGKVRR